MSKPDRSILLLFRQVIYEVTALLGYPQVARIGDLGVPFFDNNCHRRLTESVTLGVVALLFSTCNQIHPR